MLAQGPERREAETVADPDSRKTYRRRHVATQITERRVVRTVVGVSRRVKWRLRELKTTLAALLEAAGNPMRADSLWHTINRKRIDRATFELLTDLLSMDEVDGWDRPWPKLPPKRERVGLVETVKKELDADD
jgi:hypothetical protein